MGSARANLVNFQILGPTRAICTKFDFFQINFKKILMYLDVKIMKI